MAKGNNQTKRIRQIFKEVNESLYYGNDIANSVYTHIINNYYFIKDCGDIEDIDNRISDVIYALSTMYGYHMDELESRATYLLKTINAPYEIASMIIKDVVIQLRKFDISTDDIFIFEVHQGLYQGISKISKDL